MSNYENVKACPKENGMAFLREWFPDAKADNMNFVLFSTSGVHGSYTTIEEIEAEQGSESTEKLEMLTFLVVQPRMVSMHYGNCLPETADDFNFLKELRASSHAIVAQIGVEA